MPATKYTRNEQISFEIESRAANNTNKGAISSCAKTPTISGARSPATAGLSMVTQGVQGMAIGITASVQ